MGYKTLQLNHPTPVNSNGIAIVTINIGIAVIIVAASITAAVVIVTAIVSVVIVVVIVAVNAVVVISVSSYGIVIVAINGDIAVAAAAVNIPMVPAMMTALIVAVTDLPACFLLFCLRLLVFPACSIGIPNQK